MCLDRVVGDDLARVQGWRLASVRTVAGELQRALGKGGHRLDLFSVRSPFRVYPASLPEAATADPTGQFLYVAGRSRTVSVFTINGTTGELTQIDGSPFPAGMRPRAVAAVAVPIPGG